MFYNFVDVVGARLCMFDLFYYWQNLRKGNLKLL
jgi:hypothetical protein